ncbi:MAG TPA: hypothetical protein PLH57_10805, partial [Oligoflexia bacterium]|nr:hypothetical protein [Oligoflexia bacterium]
SSGYLISWGRWPYWLQQKIFFGLIAAAINFFCIFCVLQRKRYDAVNSSKRVFYDRCVRLSILGVPFAALALWYASQRYFS